jgi:hypothetical protein
MMRARKHRIAAIARHTVADPQARFAQPLS